MSPGPVDARLAQDGLRAALAVPDGPLGDALASLDADERERLRIALRAAEPYAEAPPMPGPKTCQAPLRGMDRCGRPGAMMRCLEGVLLRGRCQDAP
jgi:hypothetical protein